MENQVEQQNQTQEQIQIPMKPNNYMALAIITTIFAVLIFWLSVPFGIVAIIKANRVNALYESKQYQAAVMTANEAKKWSLIGIGCMVVFVIIFTICCLYFMDRLIGMGFTFSYE